MELDFEGNTEVINLILDKMQKFGINYNISKKKQGSGTLPQIDIKSIETAISGLEPKIGKDIESAEIEYLLDLYKKVRNVSFYVLNRLLSITLLQMIRGMKFLSQNFTQFL